MKATTRTPLSILDLAPVREGGRASQALEELLALAVEADALGYHRYWISEHHNSTATASSATAILVARVAAATSRIRVGSGGIMLPNHATYAVAEQFGTLATFFPDRIDLGLGRAPGTDRDTARALPRGALTSEDFPTQVAELRDYLGPADPTRPVRAIPGEGSGVPLFILGSSDFGARLAAREGLPFVIASHFAPDHLGPALDVYRSTFRASETLSEPHVIAGVNVMVADTTAEARRLFTSIQLKFLTMIRGQLRNLPPVEDMTGLWSAQEEAVVTSMLRESFVGDSRTVGTGLTDFVERSGADELIVLTEAWDPADRVRSYQLLADLWL